MTSFRNELLTIPLKLLLTVLFASCSTINQDSPLSFIDEGGGHPTGWTTAHEPFAEPDGSLCTDCHGDDLAGGISGISCMADSYSGLSCHSNGPAFHPADWLNKTATGNTWHAYAYQYSVIINGFDCEDCHTPPDLDDPANGKCLICHFTIGGSRTPDSWTHGSSGHQAYAGSPAEAVCAACHETNDRFGNGPLGHSCDSCHDHNVPYLDHDIDVPTLGDFTTQCSICHGIDTVSPIISVPVCTSCHTVGSPYISTNCTSCHQEPPDTGRHNLHVDEGIDCDYCHQGAGEDSGLNHFYDNEVDVEFSEAGLIYHTGRCSGSCHGETHSNDEW